MDPKLQCIGNRTPSKVKTQLHYWLFPPSSEQRCLFSTWNTHLAPLIFFSAMEAAHPHHQSPVFDPRGRCTHAPLIGLYALSGGSWMRASLTLLPKPPQNCCDGEDQEKPLWIFDLFLARDFYSRPKVNVFFCFFLSSFPAAVCVCVCASVCQVFYTTVFSPQHQGYQRPE